MKCTLLHLKAAINEIPLDFTRLLFELCVSSGTGWWSPTSVLLNIKMCEWCSTPHAPPPPPPCCIGRRMQLCASSSEVWAHILICDTLLFCSLTFSAVPTETVGSAESKQRSNTERRRCSRWRFPLSSLLLPNYNVWIWLIFMHVTQTELGVFVCELSSEECCHLMLEWCTDVQLLYLSGPPRTLCIYVTCDCWYYRIEHTCFIWIISCRANKTTTYMGSKNDVHLPVDVLINIYSLQYDIHAMQTMWCDEMSSPSSRVFHLIVLNIHE